MLIKLIDAQEGDILLKDIMLPSNRPLMFKGAVLTKDNIKVLSAFLIRNVDVNKPVAQALVKASSDQIEEEECDFLTAYSNAVEQYKVLFKMWQSGVPTHVLDVREIIVPLLEQALTEEKVDFFLYKQSTPVDYIYHHAISVGLYAAFLAKSLGLSKGEVIQVAIAGCLCDVGMARIPTKILTKKSKLLREEYQEVKNHPVIGYKMLLETSSLKKDAQLAILQHHERLDGSGYPRGEKAEKIHLYSRIIAVADTYHALTTDKHYQNGIPPFKVLEMIRYEEFGKFDLPVVNALLTSIVQMGIGSKVILSNFLSGEVIFMNPQNITRPLIKLQDSDDMVDLETRRDLFIEVIF
ncbi:HD-GYP domain-containing protein [Bacillus massiliigorillae]|uniref:HD-GYP domain-containing protein n=1 Tax=Bacillus massiliigorillae TaxID=1243664 RepID=UPI0003A591AA|nr:HD-GYP domain-containing protein [Bacillus massiliigorillae]